MQVITVPELGRLAGPIMVKAPRTWGEVRGPLGAAVLSLRRIGWTFDNSLTLLTDEGVKLPLTSTSPALIAYHAQVAWKRTTARSAARTLGFDGSQVDATVFQRELRLSHAAATFPLLKAFITQGVWSPARLRKAGYDVDCRCIHCGAPEDTLHHRLFECPETCSLREEFFQHGELQDVLQRAEARHLLLGFQLLPPRLAPLPDGLGYQQCETWTLSGAPIEDVLQGEVFTDGSCFKEGPITWHRTGWSVIKISQDGVLLAWMRGTVGNALPQTSPASEHVATLAAVTAPGAGVTQANSDYKGLEHVEQMPAYAVYDRSQIYAGVKLEICGRMPSGFRVVKVKVKGHANPEEASTARGRYEAVGNDFADRVAKAAANAQPQPSQRELQQWAADKDLLKRYLSYVPRALSKWPSISPTVGKKSRPRLQAGHSDQGPHRGPSSFAADVLGEYGKMHARRGEPSSAPSDDAAYACSTEHLGAAPDAPPEGSSSHMQNHAQQEQTPSDYSPASVSLIALTVGSTSRPSLLRRMRQ